MSWQITKIAGEGKKINDTFKKIINLLLSASIMGIFAWGCSSATLKISHEPFYKVVENKREGNILVTQFVDKRTDTQHIGKFDAGGDSDFKAFITTEKGVRLEALLTSYFVETLKEVGYNVDFRERYSNDVLNQNIYDAIIYGEIEEFWLDISLANGSSVQHMKIRIKIKAIAPTGQNVLWEKDFIKYMTEISREKPEKVIRVALTEILNQALKDFASEEFYKAIKKK
jgi:hypothetical protein